MPRFKSNNLCQTKPKIKLERYRQKTAKSSSAGGYAPRPPIASGIPMPPSTALPMQIFGFEPG